WRPMTCSTPPPARSWPQPLLRATPRPAACCHASSCRRQPQRRAPPRRVRSSLSTNTVSLSPRPAGAAPRLAARLFESFDSSFIGEALLDGAPPAAGPRATSPGPADGSQRQDPAADQAPLGLVSPSPVVVGLGGGDGSITAAATGQDSQKQLF